MKKHPFALLLLSLILPLCHAHAGAWTRKEGETQIITTGTYYYTDSFYDQDRDKNPKASHYEKYTLDIYAEYGLSDIYTIGVQAPYQWVKTDGSGQDASDDGLADTSFFLRERLWYNDYDVLSLQQMLNIPGPYDQNDDATLGYGQADAELRLLYGHGGDIEGIPYFTDIQAAYRKRFDDPADEIRVDLTAGLKITEDFMIMGQSYNIIGLGNESSNTAFVTPSGPDYDLSKLQLSAVVDVAYDFSVQAGVADDIAGRNTGAGKSVFIGLWRSF